MFGKISLIVHNFKTKRIKKTQIFDEYPAEAGIFGITFWKKAFFFDLWCYIIVGSK